ncbi:MAG: sugar ABC transporter permease [Firmicutes bacterium]|nr:sugar ABC transporter permease [Bacillota bacterium]
MKHTLRRDFTAWMIMLPGVILFTFFVWYPLVMGTRLSFYETKGITTVAFAGLSNFRAVFSNPDFWPAVVNTFKYCLWSLVIGFLAPVALAIGINEAAFGKNLFRVSVYIPNIVPGLATVFLWRFLFRSGESGALNMLLSALGLPMSSWLSNGAIAVPLIVVTMTWKSAGATMLIYLAGLQGINPELYEAAIIDGAGVWGRVRNITIPNILSLGRTLLILQIIAVFQILYEPLVMTNGGPNNASISLMQMVYRYAFDRFEYSKASALSVLVSVILITLTLVYNRTTRSKAA